MVKLIHNFFIDVTMNDVAEPWGLFFQDNATPDIEGLEELHNNIMFYLAIVLFAVSWIVFSITLSYREANSSKVELIWTIVPGLILVLVVFPFLGTYFTSLISSLYPFPIDIDVSDSYLVPIIDLEITTFFMDNSAAGENVASSTSTNTQDIPENIPFFYATGYRANGDYIGTYLDDPTMNEEMLKLWKQGALSQGRIADVKVMENGRGVWRRVFICPENSVTREKHHAYIWGASVPNVAGFEGHGENIFIQSRSSTPAPSGFAK